MPRYQLGRLGQVYAAVESSYGTAPGFAATDAVRHLGVRLNRAKNRVNAPDRHTHPSLVARRTRRKTHDWSLGGILFPSGTINTLPDNDIFLEHSIGAKTNTTLAATVQAAPAPTTTVFTLSSVAGLAVDQPVLVSIAAGGFAGKYVRWISAIASAEITVEPALPAAPATGDSVKGCIGYKPATDLASAINLGHYLQDITRQGYGLVCDQLKVMFDANDEVRWEVSGMYKERVRPAVTGKPGAFTTVGSQPPSGLTGGFNFNGTAEDYLKAEFTLTNAMALDNHAGGTSLARGFYRKGVRSVLVGIDSMVSDDVTVLAATEDNNQYKTLLQSGDVEGNIIACYCPLVELDEPELDDNDEENEWKYEGVAQSTVGGNREFFIALA